LTLLTRGVIIPHVIQSFADPETQKIFAGNVSRKLPQNLQSVMHRKLLMVDAAARLDDLSVPPGNRLEALKGRRKGQYSIRVNSQWRICFVWTASGPTQVEIVDYH
jgi:proteic killer suppression protein